MSWDANKEKLRCLVLLDDGYASRLSPRAGQAFVRAFILEDRASGEIQMKFRFRYKNPDQRRWFEFKLAEQRADTVELLRGAVERVLRDGARMLGHQLPADAIQAFYPPDDGGDFGRTIIWLEMRGLVEVMFEEAQR